MAHVGGKIAANPKVVNAFRAMKGLGISEDKVKPVLKNLLKLYAKNWDLIEANNYRVLVDAIFENDEPEALAKRNAPINERGHEEEAQEQNELEPPLKRLRVRHQQHAESSQAHHNSSSHLAEFSVTSPKDEPVKPEAPAPKSLQGKEGTTELRNREMMQKEGLPISQVYTRRKTATQKEIQNSGMEIIEEDSSKVLQCLEPPGKSLDSERSFWVARIEEPRTGQGLASPNRKIAGSPALIVHKEPPIDDSVLHEVPVAVFPPETRNEGCSSQKTREHAKDDFPETSDTKTGSERARVHSESSSQLEVATSSSGEVKLFLSCTSPGRSGFHMPDIDTVVKLVEDKCLQAYKITDPNFSVKKLMKDICECFLQLGSEKSEEQIQTSSKTDQSETFSSANVVSNQPSNAMNDFQNTQVNADMALPISLEIPRPDTGLVRTSNCIVNGTNSNGSHLQTEQNSVVNDICKGHEKVVISLVNDVNNEAPPSFHYIRKNVVFQNAYVNFSLARIGDDNSCSHCVGDCLTLPIPCACSHETGGEFVYTAEGLVKEEFLEECVSMNRDPEKHCQFFCEECPLERSKKEEIIETCKGHLMRKFIKECWWKCGCTKQCGNRVVQQGITRNLQVFMTKGKGWALRTLEDLPKGAFVCEYVGEILTNTELSDRISKCPEGEKHSYPVLLDADWGSEGVLNDEEALCLDATYYGNVARFINHRCFDSTLVEIPVEIETPDHHYYHLAFFTSRHVKAMEELTWDYGINFGDRKHPVKAFRCQCGSRFCRNTRRPKRFRFGRRVR